MRAFALAVLVAAAALHGAAAQENADSVMDVLSSSTQLSTLSKYVQKVGAPPGLRGWTVLPAGWPGQQCPRNQPPA